MDPQSPNKLIATKYCFLILRDDTSFFFFISLFFCFFLLLLILYVIINFDKNYLIILFYLFIFFMKIIFIFSCSGMFRVPGFIDAHLYVYRFYSNLFPFQSTSFPQITNCHASLSRTGH